MKRSFIISTIFFLCAFFLISTAEAITSEIFPIYAVYRYVAANGYLKNDEVVGYYAADFDDFYVNPYGDEKASYEYGNFEFKSCGGVNFWYYYRYDEYYDEYNYNKKLTEAYQNSNITIEDNKLVLEGTGYSDNPSKSR